MKMTKYGLPFCNIQVHWPYCYFLQRSSVLEKIDIIISRDFRTHLVVVAVQATEISDALLPAIWQWLRITWTGSLWKKQGALWMTSQYPASFMDVSGHLNAVLFSIALSHVLITFKTFMVYIVQESIFLWKRRTLAKTEATIVSFFNYFSIFQRQNVRIVTHKFFCKPWKYGLRCRYTTTVSSTGKQRNWN